MDLTKYAVGVGSYNEMDEKEKRVAEILASILSLDCKTLSPNSDFFAVGGDSISAISFCQRLKGLNILVTTKDIFQLRTIKRISNFREGGNTSKAELKEIVVR
jgi:hypothetical protein